MTDKIFNKLFYSWNTGHIKGWHPCCWIAAVVSKGESDTFCYGLILFLIKLEAIPSLIQHFRVFYPEAGMMPEATHLMI